MKEGDGGSREKAGRGGAGWLPEQSLSRIRESSIEIDKERVGGGGRTRVRERERERERE